MCQRRSSLDEKEVEEEGNEEEKGADNDNVGNKYC